MSDSCEPMDCSPPGSSVHGVSSLVAQSVKNLPVMQETACNTGDAGSILGQEDPLEKEMATHSSILA